MAPFRLYNTLHNSYPSLMHANGASGRMLNWLRRKGEECADSTKFSVKVTIITIYLRSLKKLMYSAVTIFNRLLKIFVPLGEKAKIGHFFPQFFW